MNMQIAIKEDEKIDQSNELEKHQNPPVSEITNKYRKTPQKEDHCQEQNFQSSI